MMSEPVRFWLTSLACVVFSIGAASARPSFYLRAGLSRLSGDNDVAKYHRTGASAGIGVGVPITGSLVLRGVLDRVRFNLDETEFADLISKSKTYVGVTGGKLIFWSASIEGVYRLNPRSAALNVNLIVSLNSFWYDHEPIYSVARWGDKFAWKGPFWKTYHTFGANVGGSIDYRLLRRSRPLIELHYYVEPWGDGTTTRFLLARFGIMII